ncbi:MAG: zinc-binding dehydrogenase [Lachnospiraceae bacterium]|nr:zinc-binding dehydrogenase [Lachnospiraceae bacterium]
MKAVILTKPTKGSEVVLSDIDIPQVKPGWVLVKVKGFGMNHSEAILREFEIECDYIKKPIIPGIECVGEIADPSDSDFKIGEKVVALMGGMGRSFDGSYAEYALLPVHHVFSVDSKLSWAEMAAVPETYFTAWGSIFQCLKLEKDDIILIRGASCALGYVAIQLAKALGCKVIGTTHKKEKISLLENAGCDICILDDGNIKEKINEKINGKINEKIEEKNNDKTNDIINYDLKINKALELVGIKTIKDTMQSMASGGIVCNTGILGGVFEWNNFDPIKDIPNGVYLTSFYSNYPTKEMMQDIFSFMDEHALKPLIGKEFTFDKISEACEALDEGKINGKIVVTV